MKKLLLAFAAAGTLGLAALGTSTGAEAKWGGKFHGGHGFHGKFHGGHWGGHGHWGHRHWGHRWGGVRVVSYGYGYSSCWRQRWTPYGYRYVNVCVRPLYY